MFHKQANILLELDRLENLMPTHKDLLNMLSKDIRRYVWGISDEAKLAVFLKKANWLINILIETAGESFYWVDIYVELLCKKSNYFSSSEITNALNNVKLELGRLKNKEIINILWEQINPNLISNYSADDIIGKNILISFDEIYKACISNNLESFTFDLCTISHMCRGRKGYHDDIGELLPPCIDYAIKHNKINRWNPPNKRFLYLAASFGDKPFDNVFTHDQKVCCEELRMKSGKKITLADFFPARTSDKKKILNLNYEDISIKEIDKRFFGGAKHIATEIADEYIIKKAQPSEADVRKRIEEKYEQERYIHDVNTQIFVASLFLKNLTETIVVPIDDDKVKSVADLDTYYHSFHKLTELLEGYGLSGIMYPSTRMNLINQSGTNLVLFNVDDAVPDSSSIRTKIYT